MSRRVAALLSPLLIAAGLFAFHPAAGQGNPTCPTRPSSDSSNACASTAFVQNISSGIISLLSGQGGVSSVTNNDGSLIISPNSGAVVASAGSGVNASIYHPITVATALSAANCGQLINAGGNNFYTISIGAAPGYPLNCNITVADVDFGRGKAISINGLNYPNGSILWPLQSFSIVNQNNGWVLVNTPGRWVIPSSTTFYVSKSLGSNSNDGLAVGSGAFQTINGSLGTVSAFVDAHTSPLTIVVDCVSPTVYAESFVFPNIVGAATASGIGGGSPTLSANGFPTTNCIIQGTTTGPVVLGINSTEWILLGFKIINTSNGVCLSTDENGWIRFANIEIGSCGNLSNNSMVAENNGLLEQNGNLLFSNSANVGVYTTLHGRYLYGSGTITLSSSAPTWGVSFSYSTDFGYQNWCGATFSGSSTGARYTTLLGGGINTCGSGATFLPGNSAGSATNPGWYN